MPRPASIPSRALQRAVLIAGGATELAKRLEVGERDVDQWLCGEVPVPERAFLLSVEIVLLHTASTGRRN